MIKVLYKEIESVLKINGGSRAPFKIGRGIRQGCALSGTLYSLAIEPMLNKLRSCIECFKLRNHGVQHQISAYADVMILINGKKLCWKYGLKSFGVYWGCICVAEKLGWIYFQLSFRGRVLMLDFLGSTMWHKLSFVEPPKGLLSCLQTILVDSTESLKVRFFASGGGRTRFGKFFTEWMDLD